MAFEAKGADESHSADPDALTARAAEIVARALAMDVDDGAAHVDAACGANVELKDEVLRLMDAEAESRFLEVGGTPFEIPSPRLSDSPPRDGQMVGSFRVLRTIGSGGMGIVYEAEQEYPQRRVALKVLPSSLGTPGAERRFHSEVQLLARLDHPGVARMLEAGVHMGEGGVEQPYFAMEFVPDALDLISWGRGRDLEERLRVFVLVCEAVQHGHQQGVVHRDLKPANVLVATDDEPKVIDFGVAGALDESDEAARTRATQAGDVIGTLQYMAPEQLEGTVRVDTRTDIYALGLLLYELVTGEPPYELKGRSLSEIVTLIREESPKRSLDASPDVPLELRWIILKATSKEPELRYPSSTEFAADLQRFLDFRPVEAAPPGRVYTIKKFVKRNKAATAAGAAVLGSILVGTAISVSAMVKASREAENFRSMNEVLTGMFYDVRADVGGANIEAVTLLDRAAERVSSFADRPSLEADLRLTLLKSYASLGHRESAIREARRALELKEELSPSEEVDAARLLAGSLQAGERLDEARAVVASYGPVWLDEHPSIAPSLRAAMLGIGAALDLREGRAAEAAETLRRLVDGLPPMEGGPSGSEAAQELRVRDELETALFNALVNSGDTAEAEARAENRIERLGAALGHENPTVLTVRTQQVAALLLQDKFDDARTILEEIQAPLVQAFGAEHPTALVALAYLGTAYTETGDPARAVAVLEGVVESRISRDGEEHPDTLIAQSSLAKARIELGDGRGEELLREGLSVRTGMYGRGDRRTLHTLRSLAGFLRRARRLEEAEPYQEELYELSLRAFGDADLERHAAAAELGLLRLLQGRPQEASELLEPAWRGYLRRADPKNAETLVLGNNLAGSLFESGRIGEGIVILIEVLGRMRTDLEPDDTRFCQVLMNLSGAREMNDELNLALERRQEALEWCVEHLEEDEPRRLNVLEAVGHLLVKMGRAEEALSYYADLMAASKLNPKLGPVERNRFRLGYARSLVAARRYPDSVQAFETIIEMEKARLGDADPEWIAELMGELSSARVLQEEAANAEVD